MKYRFEVYGNSSYAGLHVDQRLTPLDEQYHHTRKESTALIDKIMRVATTAQGVGRIAVKAYEIQVEDCSAAMDREVILSNLVAVLERELNFGEWTSSGPTIYPK